MMLFVFNIDRVCVRGGSVLLSRKRRHFRVDGISQEECKAILECSKFGIPVDLDEWPKGVVDSLIDHRFVCPSEGAFPLCQRQANSGLMIRLFRETACFLRVMGSVSGLAFLVIVSAVFVAIFSRRLCVVPLVDLLQNEAAGSLVCTVLVLLASIAIHELGHATASSFYAGDVGGVRLCFLWGVPAISVDVTVLCLAKPMGRFAIAVAGPVFQAFFSCMAIAVTDIHSVNSGASLGLAMAVANLIPTPGQDGYWAVIDLLRKEIRPRIIGADSALDVMYGMLLGVLFAVALPGCLDLIALLAARAKSSFELAPVRATLLVFSSLGVLVSTALFGLTLFSNLFLSLSNSGPFFARNHIA